MDAISAVVVLAALTASPADVSTPKAYQQLAVTCFRTGEETSGMNKICYYNCLGSKTAITIKSSRRCPMTIRR